MSPPTAISPPPLQISRVATINTTQKLPSPSSQIPISHSPSLEPLPPVATPISTIPPHLPDSSPFESHLIPTKRTERASSFPIVAERLLALAASLAKLHRDPLATRAATITAISAQF
ncbi:unnamed protein product [Linum trigynum]|uniref:Uncharacterized protein n=1 Tax=Linum trigynum TaxID=586398 RepID=A0AAV2ESD8_9ROSI